MQIWLKNNDYNIRFPVLPSDYSIKESSNNALANVNALGDVALLGNKALEEVEFSTLFPAEYNRQFCDIVPEYKPYEYRNIFKSMKDSGVCILTLSKRHWCKEVTIEELEYSENDGSDDLTIRFRFREYRAPKAKPKDNKGAVASLTSIKAGTSARTAKTVSKAFVYEVKKGDTLSSIAAKKTGNSNNWRMIYADNKSVIGSNPNRIQIGMKLKIRAKY